MTFGLGAASLSGTRGSPCRSPLSITAAPQDYVGREPPGGAMPPIPLLDGHPQSLSVLGSLPGQSRFADLNSFGN